MICSLSWLRRHTALIFVLLCVVESPALAQATPSVPVNSSAVPSPDPAVRQVELNPTYTSWFDRRLAVAEAQIRAQEDASSDLGLTLTLVGIGFGALLTGLIIFFALRTERTASAAASAAAREEIRSGKAIIDEAVEASRKLLVEAERVLDEIRSNRGQAYEHIASIRAAVEIARRSNLEDQGEVSGGGPSISTAEGEQLRQAASTIVSREQRTWSVEEFKVLLAAAFSSGDLDRAHDLAIAMRVVHQDPSVVAHALNSEGVALARMNRGEEALATYDRVIERFGSFDDISVQESVAKAMRNRGVRLSRLDKKDDALAAYEAVIERYAASESPIIRLARSAALRNAAAVCGHLGREEDKSKLLQKCFEEYQDDPSPDVRAVGLRAGIELAAATPEADRGAAVSAIEAILRSLEGASGPEFDGVRRTASLKLKRLQKKQQPQ